MKKQDAMRSQSQVCVLRVNNIHCDGCKGKIRKLLKKIDGVYGTSIDVEQGKVTVTGNVNPSVLIKKLEKLGKHAEIWRSQKGENYSRSVQFDLTNNQFKNLQMGKMKDGKDRQIGYESVKGPRDLKVPLKLKDQRAVRFDLSKKDHVFDDFSGDDDFDDDDCDYEDEEFDEEDDEFGYGGHQRQHNQKKVMPIKGNNGNVSKKLKKGGGKAKKGGGGLMSMIGKVIGSKKKGKDGNVGKKSGRGGDSAGAGGGGKNKGGGNGGGEGKIGNKAGGGSGGGGKKGGGGKNGVYSDFEITNHSNRGGGGGGGGGKGQYQVPVTRGPPAQPMVSMNGGNGYYPGGTGVAPVMAGNPYQQQQQQQYMAMMMNHQRMMNGGGGGGGGDMHHMAMYGRPPPGYGFVAPPPPAYHDPYTHMFSDENTDSCSIM